MLCVKNEVVEDICEVVPSNQVVITLPAKLVVVDYTRSEKVLTAASTFHLLPSSEASIKKFCGFMNYLKDRKKVRAIVYCMYHL